MIRRVLVALALAAVVLLSGAADCDTSQPSVDNPPVCGFFCQLGGGRDTQGHDPSAEQNPQQDPPLYDPDAHHQTSDKVGDRKAIEAEKEANRKLQEKLCKETPDQC
jgi:hypothetical protein